MNWHGEGAHFSTALPLASPPSCSSELGTPGHTWDSMGQEGAGRCAQPHLGIASLVLVLALLKGGDTGPGVLTSLGLSFPSSLPHVS